MADKKKAGSALLKALGKTKKEQMKVLYPKAKPKAYPKVKGDVRGKGPYLRGTTGKKGAGDFLKRRAAVAGTKSFPKPTKARKGIGVADVVAAGAAGWAVGSGQHKKLAKAVSGHFKKEDTHLDKARRGAKELVKKQKSKKEKRKSHH